MQTNLVVIQYPLDFGAVDSDAVDLTLDPAISLCNLGDHFRSLGNRFSDFCSFNADRFS